MVKLAISTRGRVALSDDLLEHLGVRPGESVVVSKLPNGCIGLRAVGSKGNIADVFGLLKRDDRPPLAIEKVNQLAARGWAGKR